LTKIKWNPILLYRVYYLQYSMRFECSLCGMILPNEDGRLTRHTEFHSNAIIQHRNTTQGIPEWREVI